VKGDSDKLLRIFREGDLLLHEFKLKGKCLPQSNKNLKSLKGSKRKTKKKKETKNDD
jgi:hypothetical protein